jgi:hypothetical protein
MSRAYGLATRPIAARSRMFSQASTWWSKRVACHTGAGSGFGLHSLRWNPAASPSSPSMAFQDGEAEMGKKTKFRKRPLALRSRLAYTEEETRNADRWPLERVRRFRIDRSSAGTLADASSVGGEQRISLAGLEIDVGTVFSAPERQADTLLSSPRPAPLRGFFFGTGSPQLLFAFQPAWIRTRIAIAGQAPANDALGHTPGRCTE